MKNIFCTTCILLLSTNFLVSCDWSKPIFLKKKGDRGVVTFPLGNVIQSIDPANAYDLVSGNVVYQLYETLFEYHYLKRPYTLQPLLAESLPVSKDGGKTYVIKIKKNILYHQDPCFKGRKRFVKAEDFVNQIKRLAFVPLNSNGWWSFDGIIKGLNEFRQKAGNDFSLFKKLKVDGLKTPDDNTLIIELNGPTPQLLYLLAMAHTAPIPMEAIECYQNNFRNVDIGTGPFILKEWRPENVIRVVRFSEYRDSFYPDSGDRWANDKKLLSDIGKKLPLVDGIDFVVIKDFQLRWEAFEKGAIDIIDSIPKNELNRMISPEGILNEGLSGKGVQMEISPSLIYWWLSFNMKDPLIGNNKKLRYAIAHAIDIDTYIRVFTHNIGQKANSIFIPGILGYDPRRKLNFEHDIEKAKKILKMAGFDEQRPCPEIVFDTRGDDANNQQSAKFIQNELSKIGIKLKIVVNTFPVFLEKARKGEMQFWQGGWALDYPDSVNILQLLSSRSLPPGPNSAYYSNEKFEQLFNKIKIMENGPLKYRLLRTMEDYVFEDLPWIMLYYDRKYILYHDYLKNYRHSDLVFNFFKYVKIKN